MTNRSLQTILINSSIRDQRIGDVVADATAKRLALFDRLEVQRIDLAHVSLPPDSLLVPGGADIEVPTSQTMQDADAFIIVTPEYNRSIPAALKSFIDWHYAEWKRKALTIVSYGAGGGVLAGEHLRSIAAELDMVTTRTAPAIAAPWNRLRDGVLQPAEHTLASLDRAFGELIWWADAARAGRES